MQQGPWIVVCAAAVVALVVVGVLNLLGVSLLLLVLAVVAASAVVVLPWWITRHGSDWSGLARRVLWRAHEGGHHAFAGVLMRIDDDGRHVWVDGESLMRVTGQHEPEAALAARHAGCWRRDDAGVLLLRVDAVVQQLHSGRGRDEPRILRLKHYLEREVLYPAAERRRRAAQG